MRLHFFTVNDIEDYRKHYPHHPLAKEIVEKFHPRTTEDLDQEFFLKVARDSPDVPEKIFETKIFGETGIDGLRLDFNFGLRLDVPEGNFRVKIGDLDTGEIFFDKYISGGRIISVEKYFIRWHVEVFLDEEKIFTHTLDLEGQSVAIICRFDALGDTLAFVPYFREFQKIHRCKLSVFVVEYLRELVARLCPDVTIVDRINLNENYAMYYPAMMISPLPNALVDTRIMSLTRIGGVILGINYLPPKNIFEPTAPPVTNEPYVCIGIQARNTRKSWLWPGGWDIVVDYLKSLGYRVFCIDKNAEEDNDGFKISMPAGAENFTGNLPLMERANMLAHAEFFIGLSSGLAWVADAVNCPVVLISGFTQDWNEFSTPYRVANRKVCNGCCNDVRTVFFDKCICPYHEKTPRELECQKKISPRMVIDAIEHLIVNENLRPPALRRNLP